MIKTYMPNALMRAATDIIKKHPINAEIPALSEQNLKDLVHRVAGYSPEELSVAVYALARDEVAALCRYLPHNKFRVRIANITEVVNLRMNPLFFQILFKEWQKFPTCRAVLDLLGRHDTEQNHGTSVKIHVGLLKQCAHSNEIYRELVSYVQSNARGSIRFAEKYKQAGLDPDYPLYVHCYGNYLKGCTLETFQLEQDECVARCAQSVGTQDAERIFLNLLISAEQKRTQLKAFPKCFRVIYNMWKAPKSGRFPPHQERALSVYIWWFNYSEMFAGFSSDVDPRRINFWEKYMDRCDVTRMRQHKMVVFYFQRDCVIEFETVGKIYIFERQYFKQTVLPRSAISSTTDFKSWLHNFSQARYAKSHQGRWEPDVATALRAVL